MQLTNDHPLVKLISKQKRDVIDTLDRAHTSTRPSAVVSLYERSQKSDLPSSQNYSARQEESSQEYGPHAALRKKQLASPVRLPKASSPLAYQPIQDHLALPFNQPRDLVRSQKLSGLPEQPTPGLQLARQKRGGPKSKKELALKIKREQFPVQLLGLALPAEQSDPNELMLFLKTVLGTFGLEVEQPWVKKYRNCMVFGSGPVRVIRYYSGRVFIGSMEGAKKDGRGLEWQGKNYFIGDWVDGKRTGYGIEVDQGYQYSGQWKAGVKHGQGRQTTGLQDYQGGFMFGVKHGQGEETFANGDYYKGSYASGEYHGTGELLRNGSLFKGEFIKGEPVAPVKKQSKSTNQHQRKQEPISSGAKRFNIRSTKKVRQQPPDAPSFEESSISRRQSFQNNHKEEYWRDPISEESQLAREMDEFANNQALWQFNPKLQHRQAPAPTPAPAPARQRHRVQAHSTVRNRVRRPHPPEHIPLYPFNMFTNINVNRQDESHNLSREKSTVSSKRQTSQKNKQLLQIYYPRKLSNFHLDQQSFDEPLSRRVLA